MTEPWWISIIKALIIINLVLFGFAYLTLLERKVMGRMQLRYGPNRAGPYGLLQPIADLVKLIRKESFFPAAAIDIPFIHIADTMAQAVRDRGLKTVGLLATAYTMEQDFYVGRLRDRHDLDVLVPAP